MDLSNRVAVITGSAGKEDVVNILKETPDANLGLSIIVQGIPEEVNNCLRQVGLKPHTVHHSLGVWGMTEKLPGTEILEITTMCGHGMTSPNLVRKCIKERKRCLNAWIRGRQFIPKSG